VQHVPGIPCALFQRGRNEMQSSGETRRENAMYITSRATHSVSSGEAGTHYPNVGC